MQIADKTVVTVDHVLEDDDGQVLDTSEGTDPLPCLHGASGILPGLGNVLAGKQAGDEQRVSIAPEDACGHHNDAQRQDVPREQLDELGYLALGTQSQVETSGGPLAVMIAELGDDMVTIDGNHPLAGVDLNSGVSVREVREATDEEFQHDHADGPHGHSH